MGICTKTLKYNLPQNKQGNLSLKLNKIPTYLGYTTSRVNRFYNEDRLSMNLLKLPTTNQEKYDLKNDKKYDLPILNINIFDGHGGDYVVKELEKRLSEEFAKCKPSKQKFFDILKEYKDTFKQNYWSSIYKKREKYFDKYIMNCSSKKENLLYNGSRMIFDKRGNLIDKTALLSDIDRLRIYQTFLNLDLDIYKESKEEVTSGSTASSLFLAPLNEDNLDELDNKDIFWINNKKLMKLYIAQLGDCKVLICDKEGIAHNLTLPHHPNSNKFENKRLSKEKSKNKKDGDFKDKIDEELISKDSFGEERFLNSYANTRSFGDYTGKSMGLTSEPDLYSYLIGCTKDIPYSETSKLQFGGDECFIVMVTDGISNLMTDQEIVDFVTSTVNLRGNKRATPQFVCDELIKYIMAIGSKQADNATCVVLRLSNWGNWPLIDRTGKTREEKLYMNDEMRE
ncbi:hypothetical protein ACO0OL_001141 [Hanseniaspora opuntiae]|uniref:[Pyruvate dehydrogenase [acetyl-transferring]]-phosphatase 2, mitochondrial n=1 Tax=Hanseniaspora opuntiae TaxID=211096 RepID=A0A1E5R995_9ASCO|nr:[Pyruvate dehydrogenase [acetyl-transferring]]-phosphatase 2, mitochondrial [Hanseniaspora opuntiae]